MLTQRQIKPFVDVGSLPDTAVDFLRFVTEFFDIIRQSGPHIYHSALLLTPQSSVVRKLYSHQIRSQAPKVVNGIPTSWDSCTASAGVERKVIHAAWSPCGKFIAASFQGVIQIQDSTTLERLSVFISSAAIFKPSFEFLAFSPDGRLLAYVWKDIAWLVVFPVSASTLTSVPRSKSDYVSVWDVQAGVVIINIHISQFGELVFSGNSRTITLLGDMAPLVLTMELMAPTFVRVNFRHHLDFCPVLTGLTRNHAGFPRVPKAMGNLRSTSRSSDRLPLPRFTWPSHSLCHFTMGKFPSPMFPSTHHSPLRSGPSSSIFETQGPYCRPEQLIHRTLHRDTSRLMGASSHAEHREARFVFGKTHPQVTCPGVLSDPGCHSLGSHSHPQHPRS